jgi:WD40 repeat protein
MDRCQRVVSDPIMTTLDEKAFMFDPYHKWLGIPREEQPPNHYRLLGLSLFETDLEVIDAAANRQMAYLQGCATGTHSLLSQRLLNEVASARLCLLTPEKKATYDARVRSKRPGGQQARTATAPDSVKVPAPGVQERRSDKRFPILEGIDEEAEPYEIIPLHATPRPTRSFTKKRSRLPVVVSILVTLVGVLSFQSFYKPSIQEKMENSELKPNGSGDVSDRTAAVIEPDGEKNNETTQQDKEQLSSIPLNQYAHIRSDSIPLRDAKNAHSMVSDGIERVRIGEVRRFLGHTAGVMSVLFSPDNKLIISGSRDRSIRIWSSATGTVVQKLEGHEAGIWGLAITKDQRLLASCGPDKTVRIWDMASGKNLNVLHGHTSWIYSVAFSSDGDFLLSGGAHSDDPTTRLWDTKTGREIYRRHPGGVVAFAPNSHNALSRGDGTLVLWNTTTRKNLRRYGGYPNDRFVSAIAFSPEGNGFLSAMESDGAVSFRSLDKDILIKQYVGSLRTISSVAFCENGKLVAAGGTGGTEDQGLVSVWGVEKEQEVHCFHGHNKKVCSVAISADGEFVVSGSEDGSVRLWRLR